MLVVNGEIGCVPIRSKRRDISSVRRACHGEYCEGGRSSSGYGVNADTRNKIGKDYFRQVVGIPQGSVLSTLLCSFFYGDLERRHLKFTEDSDCVCGLSI